MKEIKFFDSREEMKVEKRKREGVWRPLHTDFINKKYKVTFVNGTDDPDKTVEVETKRQEEIIKKQRKTLLKSKLDDDSMTFDELKEYLRE